MVLSHEPFCSTRHSCRERLLLKGGWSRERRSIGKTSRPWKGWNVTVSAGDVILLYTGRWKRRAALGAWPRETGFAGCHADVAYFLKERGVSFIGGDGPRHFR